MGLTSIESTIATGLISISFAIAGKLGKPLGKQALILTDCSLVTVWLKVNVVARIHDVGPRVYSALMLVNFQSALREASLLSFFPSTATILYLLSNSRNSLANWFGHALVAPSTKILHCLA